MLCPDPGSGHLGADLRDLSEPGSLPGGLRCGERSMERVVRADLYLSSDQPGTWQFRYLLRLWIDLYAVRALYLRLRPLDQGTHPCRNRDRRAIREAGEAQINPNPPCGLVRLAGCLDDPCTLAL